MCGVSAERRPDGFLRWSLIGAKGTDRSEMASLYHTLQGMSLGQSLTCSFILYSVLEITYRDTRKRCGEFCALAVTVLLVSGVAMLVRSIVLS